ncbi:MAG TPA: IclR family transcriptional regulator [Methylomirabilota bacterium]|jgi:IclR family KDG regulon transcriptional repressor|nr:IclR family transcriptional regulator [Methylomirabilota bacterium]
MKKAKADYLIQSVSRALDILEAFTSTEGELGVTELSRRLKLHKNNVFRLLATLETRGYVEQDRESGNYRLGLKTFEVASVFTHHLGVVRQARPVLEQLAQATGEAAYLGVLDGANVVCIDMVETTQPVRAVSHLGRRLPAHAAALGKAQLAFRSREEREEWWKQAPPAALTGRTLTEPAALVEELGRVAERDLAVEDEELEPGVRALAAPVRDYAKRVVGAISIRGPAFRLPPERLEPELAARVRAAARDVSKRLGFAVSE